MPDTTFSAPIPLFGPFPPTTMLNTYAWKAYVTKDTIITSTVANPRPLSDIPQAILGMVYYHDPQAPLVGEPMSRTIDYGDVRPYTFRMPDGTTRTNSVAINATTYTQFKDKFLAQDTYPV